MSSSPANTAPLSRATTSLSGGVDGGSPNRPFQDPRLKQLQQLLGVPNEHLRVLATCPLGRHATIETVNPLRVVVGFLFKNDIQIAVSELDLDVEASEEQLTKTAIFIKNNNTSMVISFEGWKAEVKKVGQVLDQFQNLFGEWCKESLLTYLVNFDPADSSSGEKLCLDFEVPLDDTQMSAFSGISRLALGMRLQRVNQITGANLLAIMFQTLGRSNRRSTAAALIAHRYFSVPISVPFLLQGQAIPPFKLMPWSDHPVALFWLKRDQATATEAFKEACTLLDVSVEDGGSLMRLADYAWIATVGDTNVSNPERLERPVDLVRETISQARSTDGRVSGSLEQLWNEFTSFF